METVTEIIAFSHGGSRRLWHPFSAKFGPCCNVICSESMHQSVDLVDTFQMMFTTNNHNPELLEQRNSRMVRRLLFGNNPMKVECSVSFKTEGNEYVLRKCLIESHSVEIKISKVGTNIVYSENDAISVLEKLHKPRSCNTGPLMKREGTLFKPFNDHSRKTLSILANNWVKQIGFGGSRFDIDYDGRWSVITKQDNSKPRRQFLATKIQMNSFLLLISNLAQAVMKKRTYGRSSPYFFAFNSNLLTLDETLAVVDLVKKVSNEENIQVILAMNAAPELASMINGIKCPPTSLYND